MSEERGIGDRDSLSVAPHPSEFSPAISADSRFLSSDPRVRLQAWQDRLAKHFRRIADLRAEAGWPLFALEHGLDARERQLLIRDVHAAAPSGPGHNVPLPWIVYSAEIGYDYSGFEYWQTFESKTPGWQVPWRDRIRSRFAIFARDYGGAQPDGDWANQFSIIAWPITHGILPRDLQRQLAELLYDASTSFRSETFQSAVTLGRHLQVRSTYYSSRFRQFAENSMLLGQIALALLLQDANDVANGLSPHILDQSTLRRIVDDLNRQRDARQWLAEASSRARGRIRGLARIPLRGGTSDSSVSPLEAAAHQDDGDALPRPTVILREGNNRRWQVRVQFSNLAPIAAGAPRLRNFLMRTQGRVACATAPILATGRIIREKAPSVALGSWPPLGTQLLTFDGSPPELEAILRERYRFDSREPWLFLIGSDGQARELKTRVVRAGASYVLLQKTEVRNPASSLGLHPIQVDCSGIYGLRIDVPDNISDALVDVLGILKLEPSHSLDVWPAGLPIPEWSGDGEAEVVVGQPFVLGVRSDREIGRLRLAVDNAPQQLFEVPRRTGGGAVFLELPSFSPGVHRVVVTADREDSASSNPSTSVRALTGELVIVAREPRTAAAAQVGALSFATDPRTPSLEDIWEDRIEIHVAAPEAVNIQCKISLRTGDQKDSFNRQIQLRSSCDTAEWRRAFDPIRSAADSYYDDAQSCVLSFDAGSLGRIHLSAERDFRSLRWAVRANGRRAELIDLQGDSGVDVCMYRCSAPGVAMPLLPSSAHDGVEIEDAGRLVVARRGTQIAAALVVPPLNARDFAALNLRPNVGPVGHAPDDIRRNIHLAQTWEQARLGGSSLSLARQQACVGALVSACFGSLGGRAWDAIEVQSRNGGRLRDVIRQASSIIAPARSDQAANGMLLRRLTPLDGIAENELEQAFVSGVRSLAADDDSARCARFALMLATSPASACKWAEENPLASHRTTSDDEVMQYIKALSATQFIARAARYVVLSRRLEREGA